MRSDRRRTSKERNKAIYKDKNDVIFLICAAYNIFISSSAALKILCNISILDDEFLFHPNDFDIIVNNKEGGMIPDLYLFTMFCIFLFGIGYWRIYIDGATCQPLIVALGGFGRIGAFVIFSRSWLFTNRETTMTIVEENSRSGLKKELIYLTIFDLVTGLYFIYVWVIKLNCSLVTPPDYYYDLYSSYRNSDIKLHKLGIMNEGDEHNLRKRTSM